MVASSEAITVFTAFTSTAAVSARCAIRLVRLKAVLIGLTVTAAFLAGDASDVFFAVAMGD